MQKTTNDGEPACYRRWLSDGPDPHELVGVFSSDLCGCGQSPFALTNRKTIPFQSLEPVELAVNSFATQCARWPRNKPMREALTDSPPQIEPSGRRPAKNYYGRRAICQRI